MGCIEGEGGGRVPDATVMLVGGGVADGEESGVEFDIEGVVLDGGSGFVVFLPVGGKCELGSRLGGSG